MVTSRVVRRAYFPNDSRSNVFATTERKAKPRSAFMMFPDPTRIIFVSDFFIYVYVIKIDVRMFRCYNFGDFMDKTKLSFIIVNYATKGLLEKNITNLLESWDNCEIIFVDSDSPDGSADFVEERFGDETRVILIRSKNKGLSAGYNLGLEKASGEYYFYLGTDTFPTKDVFTYMVNFMNHNKDVGIATPKLYIRDGSIDLDAHRSFPTPWVALTRLAHLDKVFPKSKIFGIYNRKYEDFDSIHEIDACISHFMCVRPEVHQKIGKWDEDYFLYGEDIDFCYRVKQAGYKVMYLGNLSVLHYKGASVGRDTAKDIENAMNTDFDKISFGDEVITKNIAIGGKVRNKKDDKSTTKSTKEWMRERISRESAGAMKTFYKKHYVKKYSILLTMLVLLSIWMLERVRSARVRFKFLSGKSLNRK